MGTRVHAARKAGIVQLLASRPDSEPINNDVEVSPVSYIGTSAFVISYLVEKGYLKVRKDENGRLHFMKRDMDSFLKNSRVTSAKRPKRT